VGSNVAEWIGDAAGYPCRPLAALTPRVEDAMNAAEQEEPKY